MYKVITGGMYGVANSAIMMHVSFSNRWCVVEENEVKSHLRQQKRCVILECFQHVHKNEALTLRYAHTKIYILRE